MYWKGNRLYAKAGRGRRKVHHPQNSGNFVCALGKIITK